MRTVRGWNRRMAAPHTLAAPCRHPIGPWSSSFATSANRRDLALQFRTSGKGSGPLFRRAFLKTAEQDGARSTLFSSRGRSSASGFCAHRNVEVPEGEDLYLSDGSVETALGKPGHSFFDEVPLKEVAARSRGC